MSKNTNNTITKDIMRKILSGKYTLHSRLPSENKLAEEYQVGRSTIRESLSVLKSLKIISSKRGGGHFVEENNLNLLTNNMNIETEEYQQIKHFFEVRYLLETEAAYLAAKRRTDEDIKRLKVALDKMEIAFETQEGLGEAEDYEFHKVMVETTKNPVMIRFMSDFSDLYHQTLGLTLKQNVGLHKKRRDVYQEHDNIYQAIKDGQPELAKVQCLIHLRNVQNKLNFIQSLKETNGD